MSSRPAAEQFVVGFIGQASMSPGRGQGIESRRPVPDSVI
jgi:hypothetical protein